MSFALHVALAKQVRLDGNFAFLRLLGELYDGRIALVDSVDRLIRRVLLAAPYGTGRRPVVYLTAVRVKEHAALLAECGR